MSVCLSVRLSLYVSLAAHRISKKRHEIFTKFSVHVTVSVARSLSDDSAIRYDWRFLTITDNTPRIWSVHGNATPLNFIK